MVVCSVAYIRVILAQVCMCNSMHTCVHHIICMGVGAVAAVAALAATLFEPSVSFLYLKSYIQQLHNNSVHRMHDLPLIELNSTSILILKRKRSQAQDFYSNKITAHTPERRHLI